jgi:cytochrome c-type biogenesis protein CcmF
LARYWWIAGLAIVSMVLAVAGGIRQPLACATIGLSAAIIAASILAVRVKRISRGAGLAHVGVAITLIGILFSSLASQAVYVSFQQGERQQVLGTNFTYLGTRLAAEGHGFYQSFSLAGEANTVLESFTKLNKEGHPAAREPGIYRMLSADIYLAPAMQQEESLHKEMTLLKGEQKQEEAVAVKLIRYGMGGSGASGDVRVYALLEVTHDGNAEEAKPELISRNGQMIPVPFKVFGHYELIVTAINMGDGTVTVGIKDLAAPPEQARIDVEISRKPLINLVWLGTVLITIGTISAGISRRKLCIADKKTASF